tara:strand:- start:699 stop:7520 length:6822 start_codon:yes stop_codon:yes gene_type:complete
MPDLEISNLPEIQEAGVQGTDPLALADISASETKKVSVKDLIAAGVTFIDDGDIPAAKVAGPFAANTVATATIQNDAINADKLATDSVTTDAIAVNAVGASELANNAVDSDAIATNAVVTTKIADLNITTDKLASNAITNVKINNGEITYAKLNLSDGDIPGGKLTSLSVDTSQLATNAVTAAKLADDAVDTSAILNSAVTGAKIAATTVTGSNLVLKTITAAQVADNTLTATQIAANAIGASELADDAVDTDAIVDGAVTSAKLASGAIAFSNITVADGDIAGAKISSNSLTATQIAADAIGSSELADDAVDTNAIVNGAVTGGKIAATTITGSNLVNNTITATQIAANTLTANEIAPNAIGASELADNSVDTDAIVDGSITSAKLNSASIPYSKIIVNDGDIAGAKLTSASVTATQIANTTITGSKLVNDTITGTQIAANAISASELADDAVDTNAILDLAVTDGKIANTTISYGKLNLADGSIPGAKIASGGIGSTQIATNAVTASELADDAVDTAAIATGAVTSTELATDAVTNAKIANNAVGTNEVVDGSITYAKLNLADGDIPSAKIGAGAITTTQLANNAVGAAELADDAVDTASIVNSAVTGAKIAATTITGSNLVNGTITSTQLAANSVTASEIGANAVGASELADDAVDTDAIVDAAVTNAKIANTTIAYAKLNLSDGDIAGAKLTSGSVTSAQLATNSVTASELADNAVDTGAIASGAVTSNEIATDTIVSGNIAANAITASEIANNAVTTDKIIDGAITAAKLSGTLSSSTIADDAVVTAKIADDAVTSAKLAANAVDAAALANNAVDSGAIATGAVVEAKLGAGAVTVGKIADGTITPAKLNTSNLDRSLNVASGNLGINNVVTAATRSGISYNAQGLITSTVALAASDLPIATASAVGGVSIGAGLSITGAGALSLTNSVTGATVSGITFNAQGMITAATALTAADLPVSTTSAKGAVQITSGGGLTVDGSGGLTTSTSGVTAGTYQSVTVNNKGVVTAGAALTASQIPSLAASKITSGSLDAARIANDSIDGTKLSNASTAIFQSIAQSGYPTAQFNGQILFDTVSEDAFIWDGNAWQAITTLTKGSLVFGGTFNANTSQMVATTSAGIAAGLSVGSNLPTPSETTDGVYVVVSSSGTPTSPAPVVALAPPDYILGITNSAGSSWNEVDLSQTVAGQIAANITFTPYGQLSATNVQDALQELETEKMGFSGGTVTGQLLIGNTGSFAFEGSTVDAYELTLTAADPQGSDKTITFPDVTGTVVTTGDTGTVTGAMLANGTIQNVDIKSDAAIAFSKLEALTSAQIIVGNGSNVPTAVAVTGDISINNAGLTAIAAGVIVDADISGSAAITGSKITTGTTSAVGVLQLTDSATSTSTSTAATPAAVKIAKDAADAAATTANAALPKAGGTLTDNLIIDNGKELRLSETDGDGSNYTGLKAQAQTGDITLTLPAVAPTAGQVLKADASTPTTLTWAADSATDSTKMPLAGGTFTGDVTFTGDSSDGLWDKSASAFVANLTGNVTGNVSGSAATVTGAAQSAITSLGTLTGLTSSGDINLNAQADLRFKDADSSHYVALQAPASITSSFTLTLPSADAAVSGYVLASDGSGTLSWVDPGSTSSPTFTGDATLTNDGALVGFSNLNATYTGNVKTLTVTVATKTGAHRYNGSGSSSGYKIDGKESPFLTLTPGRTYKFDQADSSNSGHPLRFYLEADKTTAYTTGVTTNGTAGSSGAYTQIVVSDTTPQVLHYQCSAHSLMGNSVQTNSNIASTAKTLATARTIGGVSFDGSANINLPGVNTAGTQDTSGTAALATEFTVTANNSTDETVYPLFVDGATGSQGAETDTGLTYNPSTGLLTSTGFSGVGTSLTDLDADNISAGTVDAARLGSGSSITTKFLRGDNTWQTISATPEGTAILSTGESGGTKFLREDGDGTCSWQTATTSAAGSNTQVQYNSSGSFAGSANLTFDGTHLSLADQSKLKLGASGDLEVFTDVAGDGMAHITSDLNLNINSDATLSFKNNGSTKLSIDNSGVNGSNIHSLPAATCFSGSGQIPVARLGTGTASSSNFLRGDGSWAAAGGGAWEVIATRDLNSSAGGDYGNYIENKGWDNTEYRQIKIVFADVGNTGGARAVRIRLYTGANGTDGAVGNASNYKWSEYSRTHGSATENAYGGTSSTGQFSNDTKGHGWSGEIIVPLKYNAQWDNYPNLWYTLTHSFKSVRGAMIYDASAAYTHYVTGILIMSKDSETFNYGKIIFMGLKV